MGRIIPLGSIPDSAVLPDGVFRVCVGKVEEVMTKEAEGKVQKVMIKLVGKVVEPKAYVGAPYFDNFVIGTNDDPEAEDLDTWIASFGGKKLKRFLAKTGVAFGEEEDFDAIAAAVKDVEVLATVTQQVQDKVNKDGSPNKYAGNVSNNTSAYWAVGEREASLTTDTGSPVAAATRGRPKVGGGKVGVAKAAVAVAGKAAPTTEISCTACNKRVPRGEMKAHVDKHIADMATAGVGEDPAPPAAEDDE